MVAAHGCRRCCRRMLIVNPHRLYRWMLAVVAVGLAGCSTGANSVGNGAAGSSALAVKDAADPGPSPCLTPEDTERMSSELLQLINVERTNARLSPVARTTALDGVASDFACRMVEEGFFSHYDPVSGEGPAARAARASYRFYFVGENLAAGQTSVSSVMRDWMASPEHRQVILSSKWREAGIGLRQGGAYGVYWVVEFAQPARANRAMALPVEASASSISPTETAPQPDAAPSENGA